MFAYRAPMRAIAPTPTRASAPALSHRRRRRCAFRVSRAASNDPLGDADGATNAENTTMSNLDKLLGDFGAAPAKEPREDAAQSREAAKEAKPALDAAARADAKTIAADLSAAQARIRREKSNRKNDGDDEAYDFSERAIAALVYMLPLLDGLKYSKFLFMQAPALSLVLLPIAPLIQLWGSLGFLQVIVFFGTYLGVVQNQNMKRFVRFNAQQAVLLDILLIVPDLLTRTFQGIDGNGPTGGVGLQAEILFFNTVFFFTYLSCTAGAVQSARGKTIKLPLIGDAAEAQQPR